MFRRYMYINQMRHQYKIYIITAVICFVALVFTQFLLLYNTYELLNDRYSMEKEYDIHQLYTRSIANDLFFPGGENILHAHVDTALPRLQQLYKTDSAAFAQYASALSYRVLLELHKAATDNQVFDSICHLLKIKEQMTYTILVHELAVTFDGKKYLPLYKPSTMRPLLPAGMQSNIGIRLAGNMEKAANNNIIAAIAVSDPKPNTLLVRFSMHADPANRGAIVLGQMRYTILPSLCTVLAIVILFVILVRRWKKQKRLSEMKSDFIDNITHELNTPLTTIIMATLNLKHINVPDPGISNLAAVIERQSRRLQLLVSKMLEMTVENKLLTEKMVQDVNTLVSDIVANYTVQQHRSIYLDLPDHPLCIETDSFHFTTMLQNLIDNAMKYNRQDHKLVHITVAEAGKNAMLSVADNGIGMSRSTIEKIFEKYYRASTPDDLNITGLGIGLYFVQQCVRAHNWQIDVFSTPGYGSRFVITIPLISCP
ncbi:two-component system, OmpR family, phosphate regulon sensor histidine kinase PhoR [Chitinophaga jiangningensis]|uniref:histidine kinase n=2 Tax=Chitinophaga jiangningensis TaxID=1419482 RepID=A0A1M7LY65_9BACT|nr:two-component system, OmpR family, phosphate regulon sensor histidine kinase PhoR [Chitinophaga jiangningensis]